MNIPGELVYDHPQALLQARRSEIKEIIKAGNLPPLPNGWSFAYDDRPDVDPSAPISADAYTANCSNRVMLVAPKDSVWHAHDRSHMTSYQDAFAYAPFADLVQSAARNALGDIDYEQLFTGEFDHLGDALFAFEAGSVSRYLEEIDRARYALEKLTWLCWIDKPDATPHDRQDMLAGIWQSMIFGTMERLGNEHRVAEHLERLRQRAADYAARLSHSVA